jgi:hypothetical protein
MARFRVSFSSMLRGLLAGVLVLGLQSALAFEVVSGDFEKIRTGQTDKPMVWQYADNPSIYVFDFPGLTLQGRTFNRITQFTEQQSKREAYPKVLTSAELERFMANARRTQADFAFGHDVLVSELVQFFNFAQRDQVVLYPEEIALRDFLVERGMMRNWRGFWQGLQMNVVILSVPQVQERKADEPKITEGARYTILLHEMSHAEYYTNPAYAKYCLNFVGEVLTQEQRDRFIAFLSALGYQVVGDDELLINETQAYLMFTPDPKSFSAGKLGVSAEELAAMRAAFVRGRPPIRLPFSTPGGI